MAWMGFLEAAFLGMGYRLLDWMEEIVDTHSYFFFSLFYTWS